MIHDMEGTHMDLISLGYAAQVFQRNPAELKIVLDGLKATPQLTLNGVGHYRFEDVARAQKYLDDRETQNA